MNDLFNSKPIKYVQNGLSSLWSRVNNYLLDVLFVFLFIFILIATGLSWIDAQTTLKHYNKAIEKISLQNVTSIDSNNKLNNIINKYDTTKVYFILTPEQFAIYKQELSSDLKDSKNNILDSNSIAFLFEMLSFLILGLGVFLLHRGGKAIKEAEKYSSQIININNTSTLLKLAQTINYYALALHKDDLTDGKYNNSNMKLCYLIINNIEKILNIFENNSGYKLSGKNEKILLLELISDVKTKLDVEGLLEIEGYYTEVGDAIDELISKISKISIGV